jgi:amino acid transporter
MAQKSESKGGGLRKNAISVIGAVALAMAFMGPATSVFFNTGPVAAASGYALPFALVLGLIVVLLVASAVGAFAKKISTAGFAYVFNTYGFGKKGGFISGWILIFAYAMVGPMLLSGIGALAATFVQSVFGLAVPWWIFTVAFALITWGIGILGVSRTAETALIFLAIEVVVMLVLACTILLKGGAEGVSLAPFNPIHSLGGVSGLGTALLWSILFFVGFESAGTLGEETQNARRNIPIALFAAAGIIGIFYIFTGWAGTLGYGLNHVSAFASASSPWTTLAARYWGSGLVWIVSLVVLSSIFANLVSGINATVRVLFVMGREGILPRQLGKTTAKGNPANALTAYMAIALILALIGGVLWTPLGAYGFFGTIVGLGVVFVYILLNLALIVFYKRDYPAEFSLLRHGILPVIASLILLLPVYGLIWPVPAYPNNLVPYIMIVWIIIGIGYLFMIARKDPALLDAIGQAMGEDDPHSDAQEAIVID